MQLAHKPSTISWPNRQCRYCLWPTVLIQLRRLSAVTCGEDAASGPGLVLKFSWAASSGVAANIDMCLSVNRLPISSTDESGDSMITRSELDNTLDAVRTSKATMHRYSGGLMRSALRRQSGMRSCLRGLSGQSTDSRCKDCKLILYLNPGVFSRRKFSSLEGKTVELDRITPRDEDDVQLRWQAISLRQSNEEFTALLPQVLSALTCVVLLGVRCQSCA